MDPVLAGPTGSLMVRRGRQWLGSWRPWKHLGFSTFSRLLSFCPLPSSVLPGPMQPPGHPPPSVYQAPFQPLHTPRPLVSTRWRPPPHAPSGFPSGGGGRYRAPGSLLGSEGARQPWCREEGVGSGKPETAAAHTLGQRDVNIRGPGSVGRSSEKTGPVNPHPRKVGRGELALELVGDPPPLAYQRHQRGHNWSGDLGVFFRESG